MEDHGIGTMAFVRSKGKPINLIMLSKQAIFRDHPVKEAIKDEDNSGETKLAKQELYFSRKIQQHRRKLRNSLARHRHLEPN